MKNFKFWCITLLVVALLVMFTPTPVSAGESYLYQGSHGFGASFYLIGGQYSLYINAHVPAESTYDGPRRSCRFAGTWQRVWPTQDSMTFGGPVPITTIHFKIGPTPVTAPAGLYSLHVTTLSDCNWTFSIVSSSLNPAGIAPVQMLRKIKTAGLEFSSTASLNDEVEFYAQFRTDHDLKVPVSGTLQIINNDKVVQTFPLQIGKDDVTLANALFQNVRWELSDAKYLGKNTVKFIVKIGSEELTSSGEFTLTQ
jgi:hypothetical protein